MDHGVEQVVCQYIPGRIDVLWVLNCSGLTHFRIGPKTRPMTRSSMSPPSRRTLPFRVAASP